MATVAAAPIATISHVGSQARAIVPYIAPTPRPAPSHPPAARAHSGAERHLSIAARAQPASSSQARVYGALYTLRVKVCSGLSTIIAASDAARPAIATANTAQTRRQATTSSGQIR